MLLHGDDCWGRRELQRGARLQVAFVRPGTFRARLAGRPLRNRAKMRNEPALRRLVVHGSDMEQVSRSRGFISCDRAMARRVSFDPAPAQIGTRPRACSTTTSTTRRCSAGDNVAASPVEPQGTRK